MSESKQADQVQNKGTKQKRKANKSPQYQPISASLESRDPVAVLQRATATSPSDHSPADILALQRTVGNQAVTRLLAGHGGGKGTPIIQRNPIKDKDGDNYHDSNYPGVKMRRLEGKYPYKYQILNPGRLNGTIIVDDDGDYYIPDKDGYADYEKPFKLIDVVMDDPNAQSDLGTINVRQPGIGVVAGEGAVTLNTSGLNTCVAWLLCNAKAAYMEHILVGNPNKVKPDGIAAQIVQIQQDFAVNTGSAATDVYIHVDASQPGYRNGWPGWIDALEPGGCTVHKSKGNGTFRHEVRGSDSKRTLWRSAKISLQYED